MPFLKATLLVLFAALAVGCGQEDEGTSNTPSPVLAGTWRATKAEFTSVAPPTRVVDIVAKGGTVTLALVVDGTFTFTLAEPGGAPDVRTGTWTSGTDQLKLILGPNNDMNFEKTLKTNTLTLTGGHAPFDFNSGNMEEALLNLILTRQ